MMGDYLSSAQLINVKSNAKMACFICQGLNIVGMVTLIKVHIMATLIFLMFIIVSHYTLHTFCATLSGYIV